jgi:hypothetical protein
VWREHIKKTSERSEMHVSGRKINELQKENVDLRSKELNCNLKNKIAESEKKQCFDKVAQLEVDNKDLAFKALRLDEYAELSRSKDQV